MQPGREVRSIFNRPRIPFDDFGFPRGFPSIFGGKDPFDDPFFTRPVGTLFGPSMFSTHTPSNVQHRSQLRGPVIEELDDDDDDSVSKENGTDDITHAARVNTNPVVEHPEDQVIDRDKSNGKHVSYKTSRDKLESMHPQSGVSFQRVTYGGINGEYSTAITTHRIGDDGVTLEESKEADRTTGLATHRISRGVNKKGHSIIRTLDSDGKVETMQTLHNLNQDELAGFEQAWKRDADRNVHETSGSQHGRMANWGGFPDPFEEHTVSSSGQRFAHNFEAQSSRARPKKVVTINIE